MSIKLICTDMDGTLLKSNHEISERNREAIKKAVDKGVKVAITTGRLFTSAKSYASLIGIKAPIISSNGAYIREKDEDRIIYKSAFSYDELMEINQVLKKYEMITYYYLCDTLITESILPEDHFYKSSINNSKSEEDRVKLLEEADVEKMFKEYDGDFLKVLVLDNSEGKEKLYKAKAELLKMGKFEVVSSWANNFEVMSKGTSKGNAVKSLAEMLGIKQEEVMCLGDSENDLSMITYAGIGVAMGNALDSVKAEAQYVTDNNDNDGVAKAIEKFVLD